MNLETTTQEFRTQLLHGWLVSCLLHGLLILSLLPLFRQSLMTLPKEPFHWDVALVQSTPTVHESGQNVDAIKKPPVPKPPDRTPTASLTNRTTRQAAPSAERNTSREPKTEAPVPSTSIPDNPSSVISSREAATSLIPNELPPPLVHVTEPPRQPAETPIGSTTHQSPAEETVVATANEVSSPITEPARPSPQPITDSDTPAASTIRPDYGWLQQAIFRRLEELKRSSRPSLDDSRPLKVLVKAVVSREGILLDSVVVKSSGLDHIDQEAMALVQRAFPIQLDRPLDRQQVAMRIPITYSRE